MAYIGKEPTTGNFIYADDITTSATNTYNILVGGVAFSPESANHLIVSLNGVIQKANTSFSVSGSQITFLPSSGTLSSSDSIDFILILGSVNDVGVATTVSDSAITKNKLNLISDSSSAGLTVKGDGGSNDGYIALNCSQNSHAVKIKAPPHSAGQSYTLTLPQSITNDYYLKTDGSGNLSFAEISAGGMTLLHTFTTSSATSFTQNITTTGYNTLYGTIEAINHASLVPDFYIQFNSDTGNNYHYLRVVTDSGGNNSTSQSLTNGFYYNFTGVDGFDPVNNGGAFFLHNPTSTAGYKAFQQVSGGARSGHGIVINTVGVYRSSSAISSIQVKSASTVTGGTVKIYGMK